MTNAEKQLRDRIVAYALSLVGTQEPNGDDAFIKWYNGMTGCTFNVDSTPWCCIFTSYVIYKCGVPTSVIKPFAACRPVINNVFSPAGQWKLRTSGYLPSPCDLIFFDWDVDKLADHVGIVQKVANGKVYTIEGNTSGGYSVDGVRNKSYVATSCYILGYATPNYTGVAGAANTVQPAQTTTTTTTTTKSKTAIIKEFQTWLNKTYKKKLAVDGAFGPLTLKAATEAWQSQTNKEYKTRLKIDGIFGPLCAKAARTITMGAKDNFVYLMQGMLYCRGYDPNGFDGIYGAGCLNTIKTFQKNNKLEVSGNCNTDTWAALFAQ